MNEKIAAIFDMDGVLVDNHEYHFKAWMQFCKKHNLTITRERFLGYFGGSSQVILEGIFGRTLSDSETAKYSEEKETMYRALYKPHFHLVDGLTDLLQELRKAGVPAAIATSGPLVNAEFVAKEGRLEGFFRVIIHDSMIRHLKPDPEIFHKTAKALHMLPSQCVVFEDSHRGIEAAQKAGMKVVGLATTNTPEKINHTDLIINDFKEISLRIIFELLHNKE